MEPVVITKEQFDGLAGKYGGAWCDCIQDVLKLLNPTKLSAYCIEKNYRPIHPPTKDESGIRYAYFLTSWQTQTTVGAEEVKKDYNITASFGEYNYRPFDSLQTCLEAIARIAWFEQRSPQDVARDVIVCDESKAPEVKNEAPTPVAVPPTVRRFAQTSQGTFPF